MDAHEWSQLGTEWRQAWPQIIAIGGRRTGPVAEVAGRKEERTVLVVHRPAAGQFRRRKRKGGDSS